jgi:hypothetical protein
MTSIVLSFQSLRRLIRKTSRKQNGGVPPVSLSCLSRQLETVAGPNSGKLSAPEAAFVLFPHPVRFANHFSPVERRGSLAAVKRQGRIGAYLTT